MDARHGEELRRLRETLEAAHRADLERMAQLRHLFLAEQERTKELTARLRAAKSNLAKAKDKLRRSEHKKHRAERGYRAIVDSRSWRYMQVARTLARTARKLVGLPLSPGRSASADELGASLALEARRSAHQVLRVRRRLYELGFDERPIGDLQELLDAHDEGPLRRAAAHELARWYANQHDDQGARRCLDLLPDAKEAPLGPTTSRQMAVMEAECHERLGDVASGRSVIREAMEQDSLSVHDLATLELASANFEATPDGRLACLNEALTRYGLSPLSLADESSDGSILGRVRGTTENKVVGDSDAEPLVTIIVPAYNSERALPYALDSILAQTWKNIEVLLVDDCSTDGTPEIIEEYVKKDSRVSSLRTPVNSGPYVARNVALDVARGDLVTIHDTDDWSHPEKIEIQARHLIENPTVMANTSELARATADLRFYRGNNPGNLILKFLATFLFRREPVLKKLGYWDAVRFGADTEFIRRTRVAFGEAAVVDLPTGPLTLYRKSPDSLTGSSAFGHPGFYMGARKEYYESQTFFHDTTDDLRYEALPSKRPFPVPEPMLPNRKPRTAGRRHFDVIIASEFRMIGGSTLSNAEEIKVQREMGLKTGLIQMSRYDLDPFRGVLPEIRSEIDGDRVQMLVYGEKVSCDLLIIRYPPVLQDVQRYLPDVEAGAVRVIVNQTPMGDYGPTGVRRYDVRDCAANLSRFFGEPGVWCPIGPLVRNALLTHHRHEIAGIMLADEDWTNIIDLSEWRREGRPPRTDRPRIGRHARDEIRKWPAEVTDLLAAYPDNPNYDVRILGGARTPRKLLRGRPSNWTVFEFGEIHPRDFLAELDVFIYFTNDEMVESFGRIIIEAMAAGVPTILPPVYRDLFADAAIYCAPSEVLSHVDRLMADPEYYSVTVERARAYVDSRFSHSTHIARVQSLLTKD